MVTARKKLSVSVNIYTTLSCIGSNVEFIKRCNVRQIQREVPDLEETIAMKRSLDNIIRYVKLIKLAEQNGASIYSCYRNPYYNFYKESIDDFITYFTDVIERDMQYAAQ